MKVPQSHSSINSVSRLMGSNILVLLFIISLFVPAQTSQLAEDLNTTDSNELVYQELLDQAERHGSVRVIIELEAQESTGDQAKSLKLQKDTLAIGTVQERLVENLNPSNMRDIRYFQFLPYIAMKLDIATLESVRNSPGVKSIYADKLHSTQLLSSTPLIGATTACSDGYCGQGQVVAVLDTGVDAQHLFLNNVVHQACFSSTVPADFATTLCPSGLDEQIGTDAATPCSHSNCYHGTHVAGIATGDGSGAGMTFSGVAANADIMAIQVFSQFTDPTCDFVGATSPCILSYTSDLLSALEHVYNERSNFNIAAVNMSLGGNLFSTSCDASNPAMTAAIDLLKSVNIATVVASGNNFSSSSISSPACISSAISVGSTSKSDFVSSFSNSASILDLLAPGQSINSSVIGGSFGIHSGTSMAAPHVAGAYAVLRSAVPSASVDEILSSLQDTGAPILDARNGLIKPRIQIDLAVEELLNSGPTVSIDTPLDGAIFTEGDNITFIGTADDAEDGNLSANIDWTSDLDGDLGSAATISSTSLSLGVHTITATIFDSEDLSDSTSIVITVVAAVSNTPPTVNIATPSDGTTFIEGDNISFNGTASDTEDGDLSVFINWLSSLNGDLGSGANISASNLSVGAHTITASVTDSDGNSDTDTRSITISAPAENTPPLVNIVTPVNGTIFTEGDNVSFTGAASDTEDGDISASIDWGSNLDGNLGSGASISSSSLSPGSHTITASVTDSGNISDTTAINITVEQIAVNLPPTVSISAPVDGATYTEGDNITLTGAASDPEDGNISAAISWSSDLDGSLGSGASISTSSLSPGPHTITASVTDNGGIGDIHEISITVEQIAVNLPPTVSINDPADGATYTKGDNITFTGTASDPEDGDISAAINWSSDLDGNLGSGASISTSGLSLGLHSITTSVTDSGGASDSEVISITVTTTAGSTIIAAHFDSDAQGFVYEDDAFRNTAEPGYASGDYQASGGFNGGGLRVLVGGVNGAYILDMSGGWRQSFTLGADQTLTLSLSFRYQLNHAGFYENDEYAEVLVSLDGVLVGAGGNDYLNKIVGDGNSGPDQNSGWMLVTLDLGVVTAGTHTLRIGGYSNKKTFGNELTTVLVDEVILTSSITGNFPPDVSLDSPVDGATYTEGDNITFTGTASDPEDGDISAAISWSSNLDGHLGIGANISTSSLTPGSHVITASVMDNGGVSDTEAIDITVEQIAVNIPPTVSINTPLNGATYTEGDNITFTGSANDPEDGDISAAISWSSNLDGHLGIGANISTSSLTPGPHVITTIVTDNGGISDTEAINITVEQIAVNLPPTVSINTPLDGATYTEGDNITFTGTASDLEDGDISAAIDWSSNLGGNFGSGAQVSTASLTPGPHVITASVTDNGGISDTEAINITVEQVAVNLPPTVSINTPLDGVTYTEGDNVTFTGRASDPEDGDISAAISWSSNLDGHLGIGASISTSSLTPGPHVITASVMDTGGVSDTEAINITVEQIAVNIPPTVSINTPLDGATYTEGDNITFTGIANDPEDGDISAAISWSSDLDANLGSGASISTSSLSPGVHSITTSVTDTGGASDSEVISISVTGAAGSTIIAAHFDSDAQGFVYEDDAFRNTAEPGYASGDYQVSGGFNGGGLRVLVGGVNGGYILDMSGGWRQSFTLGADQTLTLSLRYQLNHAGFYENDEYAEVLVSLDGALVGAGGNDYLNKIVGDGNSGPDQNSGWVLVTLDLGVVPAGTHTLKIGGYSNKKTFSNEITTVLVDDVILTSSMAGSP